MEICTNLELSKKAFELGITKDFDSVFWWVLRRNKNINAVAWFIISKEEIEKGTVWSTNDEMSMSLKPLIIKQYPALTAEEWGSILPEGYSIRKIGKKWGIFTNENVCQEIYENTMADAMAKMAIYLKEQGSNCLQKPYNIHRNRLKTLAFYY